MEEVVIRQYQKEDRPLIAGVHLATMSSKASSFFRVQPGKEIVLSKNMGYKIFLSYNREIL